jgi:nucleoside-diphosphate-sugar epimerase
MSVLVTGGLGHIGSWVCLELIKRGEKVIVTGRNRRRVSYLEGLGDHLKFVPADVVDQASLNRVFVEQKGAIEGVVHIAGLMGGPFFATNPRHHIYTNTMGTVDMLETSRIFGVRRFIYISSGAVYGVRDNIPREDEPLTPGDLYGAAKASAELFGLQYANEFGLDFRALRVYFAYGPGRFPSELYPLYQAVFGSLEGRTEIKLPAGADQEVDFTYLKDIAQAVRLLYEAPELKYRQYNVCSGVVHKIPELIRMVSEMAGVTVDLSIGPGRIMPRGPSLDCSRLREELGFAPEYDIKKGVEEYVEWMKAQGAHS